MLHGIPGAEISPIGRRVWALIQAKDDIRWSGAPARRGASA